MFSWYGSPLTMNSRRFLSVVITVHSLALPPCKWRYCTAVL